jgi:hypothetical protein
MKLRLRVHIYSTHSKVRDKIITYFQNEPLQCGNLDGREIGEDGRKKENFVKYQVYTGFIDRPHSSYK